MDQGRVLDRGDDSKSWREKGVDQGVEVTQRRVLKAWGGQRGVLQGSTRNRLCLKLIQFVIHSIREFFSFSFKSSGHWDSFFSDFLVGHLAALDTSHSHFFSYFLFFFSL